MIFWDIILVFLYSITYKNNLSGLKKIDIFATYSKGKRVNTLNEGNK